MDRACDKLLFMIMSTKSLLLWTIMVLGSLKALQHDFRYCASQVLPVNQMTGHIPHIYMT